MNILEKKMIESLTDLKENHGVIGIKAEFEAEGTRLEEALRLKEIIAKAGLDFTIKIGGCEAVMDMYEARVIGVTHIVAPMIESPYALKKYLQATKLVFPTEEQDQVKFLMNLETIYGFNHLDDMLTIPEVDRLDGIVFGRVDMTGSLGLDRDSVNCDQLFNYAQEIGTKIKAINKEFVIGGGVSAHSIPFFRALPEGTLDRYETRKVIFSAPDALNLNPEQGILKAVGFELMWLKNKRDFYGMIYKEDEKRINMLEYRYKQLIEEAGGKYE